MKRGLMNGRQLTQEEWANPEEKKWIDELVAEGVARATPFAWKDNFQCEVRYIISEAR